jgi:hypothetical protein
VAQIIALDAGQRPPAGAQFVLVTVDASALSVIANAQGGTTFSAANTEGALGEALNRALAFADERELVVYMRYLTPASQEEARTRRRSKAERAS